MKRISIYLSGCSTTGEFYSLLLSALEVPDWHGHNLDALWDSITSDINNLTPPYAIEILGTRDLPESVATLILRVRTLFEEARREKNVQIEFNVG